MVDITRALDWVPCSVGQNGVRFWCYTQHDSVHKAGNYSVGQMKNSTRAKSESTLFLTSRSSPDRNEKKKRKPVRRPSTPTLPMRPKANNEQGRDHQQSFPTCCHAIREQSLYTASANANTAILADRSRGTGAFTLGRRGYTFINQGGFCGFFRKPREGRTL